MKLFENSSSLGNDSCAVNAKEYQNVSINDYNLWNTYSYKCHETAEKEVSEFAANNLNLNFRNGYGFTTSCHVDNDTQVRLNGKITHEKAKTQLFQRFYQANPALYKGKTVPNLESRLLHSEDTTQIRECNKISEKDFDRFIPLVPCLSETVQNAKVVVEPWTHGGDNSRLLMRDSQHLKKCGWENKDGKVWLKKH